MLRRCLIPLLLCALENAAAFQAPAAALSGNLRLRNAASRKLVLAMNAAPVVDRRSMLAAAGTFALINAGGAQVCAADDTLKRAETVKAAIKLLCVAGSTGPLPVEDLVVMIVDDGSKDVEAAFLGVASSGAKAVKIKYDRKGGVKGRDAVQAEYQAKDCVAVITPTVDPLGDLMSGAGLECATCSYGGDGAPPKWFIVMEPKGQSNKEMAGEAMTTGWGCFDEKLAIVPGNVFKQKPNAGKIKKCGPYGIQVPVLALDTIAQLNIKEGRALMNTEGVTFDVNTLFAK